MDELNRLKRCRGVGGMGLKGLAMTLLRRERGKAALKLREGVETSNFEGLASFPDRFR